ncbi:class I SAM-dependent methyltransferase [Tolypothrix campylonemoides VB511288]|nr:class I SAM-dependent methyltransferase [Tolypothrix campylonemoides VB511288]
MSISSPIENISDTARWVAAYRAMETERPEAHFRDPLARILAGERGEEIVRTVGGGKSVASGVVVRTCIIDELILRLIEKEGVDTVLNLAAGLDTRPYRLSLPSSLHWIEADFPVILSYKQQKLACKRPACSLELVKLDLTDVASRNALFFRVSTTAKQVLVITEGLLGYLTPTQVASLAADLHTQSNFRWWIFDLMSPFGLECFQMKYGKYFAADNAKMQFAPKQGTEFFHQYSWKVAKSHSVWEEAHRLNRNIRLAWLLRLLARFSSKYREIFYRMASIVLLEREWSVSDLFKH